MATNSSSLAVASREPQHSRDARRARRTGSIPGIIYGGDSAPVPIAVNARDLRHTLAAAGAVIDLSIDGGSSQPVVLKDAQRHPVRGEIVHVDLIRVDLKQKIQSTVPLELFGADDAEAIKLGGILEQLVREVNVEALPNDIPESVTLDVATLEIGHHLTLGDIAVPDGIEIVDDAETVAVNMGAPRLNDEGELEVDGGASAADIAQVEQGGADAGAPSADDAGSSDDS
jgi:large subunit ribosomal protein L25